MYSWRIVRNELFYPKEYTYEVEHWMVDHPWQIVKLRNALQVNSGVASGSYSLPKASSDGREWLSAVVGTWSGVLTPVIQVRLRHTKSGYDALCPYLAVPDRACSKQSYHNQAFRAPGIRSLYYMPIAVITQYVNPHHRDGLHYRTSDSR